MTPTQLTVLREHVARLTKVTDAPVSYDFTRAESMFSGKEDVECPCRPGTACPCDASEEDIVRRGRCLCGLFSVLEGDSNGNKGSMGT